MYSYNIANQPQIRHDNKSKQNISAFPITLIYADNIFFPSDFAIYDALKRTLWASITSEIRDTLPTQKDELRRPKRSTQRVFRQARD